MTDCVCRSFVEAQGRDRRAEGNIRKKPSGRHQRNDDFASCYSRIEGSRRNPQCKYKPIDAKSSHKEIVRQVDSLISGDTFSSNDILQSEHIYSFNTVFLYSFKSRSSCVLKKLLMQRYKLLVAHDWNVQNSRIIIFRILKYLQKTSIMCGPTILLSLDFELSSCKVTTCTVLCISNYGRLSTFC